MVGDRETLHLAEETGPHVERHPISDLVAVPDIHQVLEIGQDCGSEKYADGQRNSETLGDLRSYENCEIPGQRLRTENTVNQELDREGKDQRYRHCEKRYYQENNDWPKIRSKILKGSL